MARFVQPDAKQITSRHIGNPQKWNRYAYVHNNPLAFIDPDGLDDFFVFRPEATSSKGWAGLGATGKKNGHTVTMYNGKDATAAKYKDALQTPGAHVVFVGHTVENSQDEAGSVVTSTGDVGKFTTSKEPVGFTLVPGPTSDSAPQMQPDPVPVPNVSANSVGIFGCDSADLQGQYGNTTFTGVQDASNPSNGTSLTGLDSAGLAFTQSMVGSQNPSASNSTAAANAALQQSNEATDKGDKVVTSSGDSSE